MGRREVVEALNRIAFAADVLGEDAGDLAVRPDVYAGAAWNIRSAEGDFEELVSSGAIANVRGVGKSVLDVVQRVTRGEPVPLLVALEERVPAGLFEIRRVPGLGPKKIRTLWRELGVTTLGELEYACDENRLLELKGFGKKTQAKVKEAVAHVRRTEGHLRLDQMLALARPVVEALAGAPSVERALLVGECRRGRETVRELDVLVLRPPAPAGHEDALGATLPEGSEEVRLDDDRGVPVLSASLAGTPCRVSVCERAARFGALALLTTGSDEHVALVEEQAAARGMRLSWEAGLVDANGAEVPCADDEDVYRALGLVPTAPERREPGVPLVLEGKAAPRLLRREDLAGALHNHTTASDGMNSLEEMRDAAAARGLSYLAITEHSQTASYAGGLEAERLSAQRETIAKLNEGAAGRQSCVLLTGVESDILRDGALDYPEDVLAPLDVVVASVHTRYGQKGDELTARMVTAASNPRVDVIGHPTGRLLLGRPPSEYDVRALLDACARSGAAVELNSNPARLDLDERWLAEAKARGVLVSLAADAHSVEALDHLEYGVTIARRAGLGPEDVLNTRPLEELRGWLSSRRAAAAA